MKMSQEQKLLALLLCDIHKSLGIKDGLNADLISGAISGGHDWALDWELEEQSIPSETISDCIASFVTSVLDMFSALEDSFERLSTEEKTRLSDETRPSCDNVSFRGFDGNYEGKYRSVCRFLIKKMNRFSEFEERASLNSHRPTVDSYQRMLDVFSQNIEEYPLSIETMIKICNAKSLPKIVNTRQA